MGAPTIKRRSFGAKYDDVTSYSITYKDVFSLSTFIGLLYQWLAGRGYAGDDEDFREDFYLQRESPKTGKQIQMWWRVSKTPDEKNMYRFDIDIDITVRNLQEVEFMHNNKKATADKGEIEISVAARLVTDPDEHWQQNALIKKYREFIFDKWLKKKGGYRGHLDDDCRKLQDFIKEHLRISKSAPQHQSQLWKTRPPHA